MKNATAFSLAFIGRTVTVKGPAGTYVAIALGYVHNPQRQGHPGVRVFRQLTKDGRGLELVVPCSWVHLHSTERSA